MGGDCVVCYPWLSRSRPYTTQQPILVPTHNNPSTTLTHIPTHNTQAHPHAYTHAHNRQGAYVLSLTWWLDLISTLCLLPYEDMTKLISTYSHHHRDHHRHHRIRWIGALFHLLDNQSLTHSLTLPLTHSLTHSLTHLLSHSLTLILTHSPTHSLTHSLTHSQTHSHKVSI